MNIIIQDRNVSGIPIIDVYESDVKEKRPVILMLHGSGSRKENFLVMAYDCVKNGFFVTLFDAYGYGDLKDSRHQMEPGFNKENIDNLLKDYTETSKYINIVANSYEDNEYVDSNRVALIGVSMGAHTIYYNILKERSPKIKVAVPIIGSPTWVSFVRSNIALMSTNNIEIAETDIIKAEEYMKAIEPLNFSSNLANFPLLMINGIKDEIIPINVVRKSFIKLQEDYIDKQKIKSIEYDVGHTYTWEMLQETYKWIKEYI